ncbi:MAG TPA: hypothetical protein VFT64_11595 [Rickettsiales bacterium]|nr:hypothetical protein [Rickettsiales bacterium]
MENRGKFSLVAIGLAAFAVPGIASAETVDIPQVPADSTQVNNAESGIHAENRSRSDYQSQILNNPELNDRARAESIIRSDEEESQGNTATITQSKKGGGNTATIIQNGKSNRSSIMQEGSNNHAYQRQHGKHNDLRVEQYGEHNTSHEEQEGDYNHKVKIQNGHREEETDIEQAAPASSDQ